MTYYIRTNQNVTLFEIEYYAKKSELSNWYLELHACPCVKNLLRYVKYYISNADYEEFCEDCDFISELRGWLWEQHSKEELFSNTTDGMEKLQYGYIKNDLEILLNQFANKYGFCVVID